MRVKGGTNEDEKERGIRKVVSYKERKHTVLNSSSFPKIYYGVQMQQSVMERHCLGLFSALHSVRFCFRVPQYTTETFVVLSSAFRNMLLHGIKPVTSCSGMLRSTYQTTAAYAQCLATECYSPAPLHTGCLCSGICTAQVPALYCGLWKYQNIQ